MSTSQLLPPSYSFREARDFLAAGPQSPVTAAALRMLDHVVESKPASLVLSEAMAVADADLQETLAALCILSQGRYSIFDARLVYEDERGGRHVLPSTPAKGTPFLDPATGNVVDDPEARMTFRFDVCRFLMERAA